MPIVATSVLEARRAAKAAAEAASLQATASPPATLPLAPPPAPASIISPPPAPPPASSASASKRRGHAVKGDDNKWQPTGEYEVGFSRPPEATRFKKGGKGGPGRPKGSISHDALIRRELLQKQKVRINGKEQKLSNYELTVKQTVRAGLDGKDRNARKYILEEGARLLGGDEASAASGQPAELTASDARSVEEFMEELRNQIREEIERELAAARQEQQP